MTALLHCCRESGLNALLTGQCGNALVSWTGVPVNLWTLVSTGNWPVLLNEFQRLAGPEWVPGLYYLVRNQILRPIVEHGRYLSNRWQQRGREPWESYAAINPDWARSLNLTQKMRADGHDPFFRVKDGQDLRFEILRPGRSIIGHLWAELGAGYGVEVRDPTMDLQLMKFCLAVPNQCYYNRGRSRLLLRESFAGLMPPQVLWNQGKGLQAADIGYRAVQELSALEAIIRQLERSVRGREVLDLPRMRTVLDSLKAGFTPESTTQCGAILLRGLMTGLFPSLIPTAADLKLRTEAAAKIDEEKMSAIFGLTSFRWLPGRGRGTGQDAAGSGVLGRCSENLIILIILNSWSLFWTIRMRSSIILYINELKLKPNRPYRTNCDKIFQYRPVHR